MEMVILISSDINVLPGIGGSFERVPSNKIEEVILDYTLRGEAVVAVYPRAYERLLMVIEKIKAAGGNPFLYQPVSAKHAEVLGERLLSLYLEVKEREIYEGKAWEAHYRVTLDKKVSRRALLKAPLNSIREYVAAPILVNPYKCGSITRCNNCIVACPYEALKGKPPEIDLSKCTGCGLCTAYCPFELLSMPGAGWSALIEGVREAKRLNGRILVVFARRDDAPVIDHIIDEVNAPVFVELVDELGWINEKTLINLIMNGAHTIIIYNGEDGGDADLLRHARDLRDKGLPIILAGALSELKAEEAPTITGGFEARIITATPVAGVVHVDPENCTICGACATNCPTQALTLENSGDGVALIFHHSKCVACRICEEICPHNAIRVLYAFDQSMMGSRVTLARDETARCRRCGKPIGPLSKIRKLEEILKAKGHSQWTIDSIWLCEDCKREAVLGPAILKGKTA